MIEDPTLVEIGKKYGKSGAQVALAWGIAHGRSVIPKSKTPARIQQNVEGDFELSAEDVKKVDAIDRKLRFNDPSEGFGKRSLVWQMKHGNLREEMEKMEESDKASRS